MRAPKILRRQLCKLSQHEYVPVIMPDSVEIKQMPDGGMAYTVKVRELECIKCEDRKPIEIDTKGMGYAVMQTI